MNTQNLQKEIEDGRVELVDVRTRVEYRSGHIEGATNIPVDELEQLTSYPATEGGRQLCLICQSGKRAERARKHLETLGVQACILENGMNAWTENKGAVIREKGAPLPLMRQVQIIVGLVNLIGLALGMLYSPWWYLVPSFTSMGLFIAGVTGTCGLALILARLPWNRT